MCLTAEENQHYYRSYGVLFWSQVDALLDWAFRDGELVSSPKQNSTEEIRLACLNSVR
jgi:hypothetical protein